MHTLILKTYLHFSFIQVEKNVFIVFYSGERAKNKVLKICDAFGANRYPFTDDIGKQYQMITEVCAYQEAFNDLVSFNLLIMHS